MDWQLELEWSQLQAKDVVAFTAAAWLAARRRRELLLMRRAMRTVRIGLRPRR